MVDPGAVRIASDTQDPASVERLLRALPEWFGLEDPIVQYVRDAESAPTYLATDCGTGEVVGVILMHRHYPEAAEIHLMAVDPQWHRRGVGRALVEAVERDLVASGARMLQVKTLGPSEPDEHYAAHPGVLPSHGLRATARVQRSMARQPLLDPGEVTGDFAIAQGYSTEVDTGSGTSVCSTSISTSSTRVLTVPWKSSSATTVDSATDVD